MKKLSCLHVLLNVYQTLLILLVLASAHVTEHYPLELCVGVDLPSSSPILLEVLLEMHGRVDEVKESNPLLHLVDLFFLESLLQTFEPRYDAGCAVAELVGEGDGEVLVGFGQGQGEGDEPERHLAD
jgi:hypothetical protein